MDQPNVDETIRFFDCLFQNVADQGNVDWRFQTKDKTLVFDEFVGINCEPAEIERLLKKHQDKNIWFGPNLRNGRDGSKHGVCQLVAAHLDIDDVTQETEKKLSEFLQPTIRVQTSLPHRQQCYWIFKEPYEKDKLKETENINLRILKHFGGDPGTQDASRVLRVAGSLNHKYDPPLPVKILELNPLSQYELEDFDLYLPEIDHENHTTADKTYQKTEGLNKLMECAFLQHCTADKTTLPEPQWYAMISIIAREPGGIDLAHELSKGYPDYSPDETDRKIRHALNSAGPATCTRIKELYDCGRDCGVKSPIGLTYISPSSTNPQSPRSKEEIEGFWTALPTFEDVDEDATDTWIVGDVLPADSITCLYGKGGLGKSHIVYDLGKAVQAGEMWRGHETKKMNVLYLDYEMTENRRGHIKKACGNSQIKIWATVTPNKNLPPPPQINGDDFEILKGFPPCLIIFDTLRAATNKNLQDDTEASELMNKLKELCAAGHTIILLLHTLKLKDRQWKGNQVIMDLSDHCLGLFKVKSKGDIEEDTSEDDDPNEPSLLFFGTLPDDKSRYPKQKTYLFFNPSNEKEGAVTLAKDPKETLLEKAQEILANHINTLDSSNMLTYPNKTAFVKLLQEGLGVGDKKLGINKARKLVDSGEKLKLWATDEVPGEKGKPHTYYFVRRRNVHH
jgi:hypothetical protein